MRNLWINLIIALGIASLKIYLKMKKIKRNNAEGAIKASSFCLERGKYEFSRQKRKI